MNRLILDQTNKLQENQYQVKDPVVLEHVHQTLNLKNGDNIKVCLIDQGLAQGKILELDKSQLQIELAQITPGEKSSCHLMVAINRPPMMKRILEHGTTLGIKSFHFIKAENSEKSYLQSKVLQEQEFKKYTNLGLSQSGCYYQRPQLTISPFFNIPKAAINSFVFDERATEKISQFEPISEEYTLAIGPERGWTQQELESLYQQGFQGINLGPSTLRVEHALYMGLGQISQILVE